MSASRMNDLKEKNYVRLNKSLRKSLKPSIWGIFAVLPEASA
jgi:hypothetical protein